MINRMRIVLSFMAAALLLGPGAVFTAPAKSAASMIADFAAAYEAKSGPGIVTAFGLDITGPGGGFWDIGIGPGRKVTVREGKPQTPTYAVVCDLETLGKVHAGTWNALTAAGKARESDPSPLDLTFMEGFVPSAETMPAIFHVIFHFFNTSNPEIVRFGEANSRFVHGGNAVVFYYEKGLRTAWYQLKKGMVVNADPKDQVNPFPTLFICTRGEGRGRLDGHEAELKEGTAVFIPAGVAHTFWNEKDAPCEGIIIMFGEGA